MICVFADAAALASQNPANILSGNYHPTIQKNNLMQVISSGMGERALPLNADALTVALDVVQIWAVMLTLSFTLILFFFLAFCVCTKRENSYGDFENTQGITTVKVCRNGAENGVHVAPLGTSTLGSPRATDETSEASSRYTHKRELPAIPTNASGSNKESLLQKGNEATQGGKPIGGVQVLPVGAMKSGGRVAVVKESVALSSDAHDGRKKNITTAAHSYVMISHSKKDHAYAKVVHGTTQETDTDNYDDPELIQKDIRGNKSDNLQKTSNLQTSRPTDQNRSSFAGIESAPDRSSSTMMAPKPAVAIPAAMAISGRTRANEELPYMTPASLQQSCNAQQQQNYSGDSHDSRGYTSISVREPLAALKARQQHEERQSTDVAAPASKGNEQESEGYYMTVSDDSADETYACIDENSRNGSNETYARINRPSADVTNHSANTAGTPLLPTVQESSPPAPPSVDSLKHVVHSRQASAGSAASTGLSSPNAERRATKSPLPPLPQGDPDLYSKDIPESIQRSTTEAAPRATDYTGSRPLEEMYAKVNKKRSSHSRGNSSSGADNDGVLSNNSSRRSSADISKPLSSPTSVKTNAMSSSLIETAEKNMKNMSDISMSWSGVTMSSTKVPSQPKTYSREISDPGYETVKRNDPPYARVDQPENYPNYEVVRHQGTSDVESEYGYETLRHKEYEPGYETVQEVTNSCQTRYGNRNSTSASDYEAGYETVNRSADAGYESVKSHEKGEYDPGYEELSGIHARSTSECDPNYEQLKFNTTNSESGYEAVRKGSEGNYELVSNYETQERPAEIDSIMPLYATVNKKTRNSTLDEHVAEVEKEVHITDHLISKDSETEHISLIPVIDDKVESKRQPGNFAPLITGAIVKYNYEALTLSDTCAKAADPYSVMESPEDVELPSPELVCLEVISDSGVIDSSNPPVTQSEQETTDLLGSLSKINDSKALDLDLLTGLSKCSGVPEVASMKSGENIGAKCEEAITDLLMSIDDRTQIDITSESLPPPPTSMFDDMSTHVMHMPPPVDDICGNQEICSRLLENSTPDTGTKNDLSSNLDEFMPHSLNGGVNDYMEAEPPAPIIDIPSLMDVPPPPQMDAIEASLAASITVTVNPMANIEDRVTPPPVSSLIRVALSSESSGSTANGGSVESVVTVDGKNGIEISTSIPPTNSAPIQSPQPLPPTSTESKDGHEGLTPV